MDLQKEKLSRECEGLTDERKPGEEPRRVSMQQLTRQCVGLTDVSKSRRRAALVTLQTLLGQMDETESDEALNVVFEPLVTSCGDSAERCRELAVQLLLDLLPRTASLESHVMPLVTMLHQRLALPEPSEEIRLLLISLLCQVLERGGPKLTPLLGDIIDMLCRGVKDACPAVQSESCACVLMLTVALPRDFHVQSETMLRALEPVVRHRHGKVRAAGVQAIGCVVLHGTQGLVVDVAPALAQRLYDSNVSVRLAVVSVAGEWATQLPDRYAQFARLLPLLLTGLDDCAPEVAECAYAAWCRAGVQFEMENEEEVKSERDLLCDQLSDLQLQEGRPSLGCRSLVRKEVTKLLGAALHELHDWTLAVRLQAAGLLFQLVRHLERRSTQHVAQLWPDLVLLCGQAEDARLHDKVQCTLRLLGYFVPPATLLAVALSQQQLTQGQLVCVAYTLQGVPALPQPQVLALAEALATTSAASVQLEQQASIVLCVERMLKVAEKNSIDDAASLSLLRILLCAHGHGDPALSAHTQEVLDHMADRTCMSLSDLHARHGHAILTPLVASVPVWMDHCAEKNVFTAFVRTAGREIGEHLAVVAEILVAWSKVISSAQSLAEFLRVCQLLLDWNFLSTLTTTVHCTAHQFVSTVLTDAVLPNLTWKAGRVAGARRCQALLCLLVALSHEDVPHSLVAPLQNALLPLLLSALQDSDIATRLHGARALALLCPRWSLSDQHINQTCLALGERLDDTSREMRMLALTTLLHMMMSLPVQHTGQLEQLFKMLMLQLDDPDPEYQRAILEGLLRVAKLDVQTMLVLVRAGEKNFSNQAALASLKSQIEAHLMSQLEQ